MIDILRILDRSRSGDLEASWECLRIGKRQNSPSLVWEVWGHLWYHHPREQTEAARLALGMGIPDELGGDSEIWEQHRGRYQSGRNPCVDVGFLTSGYHLTPALLAFPEDARRLLAFESARAAPDPYLAVLSLKDMAISWRAGLAWLWTDNSGIGGGGSGRRPWYPVIDPVALAAVILYEAGPCGLFFDQLQEAISSAPESGWFRSRPDEKLDIASILEPACWPGGGALERSEDGRITPAPDWFRVPDLDDVFRASIFFTTRSHARSIFFTTRSHAR